MPSTSTITMATWGQPCHNCSAQTGSKDYCYSARIRSTVLQGLPFGGVPTVLALDFMCFLVNTRRHLCCLLTVELTAASGVSQAFILKGPGFAGAALCLLHPEEGGVGLRPPGSGHRRRQVTALACSQKCSSAVDCGVAPGGLHGDHKSGDTACRVTQTVLMLTEAMLMLLFVLTECSRRRDRDNYEPVKR